MSAGSARRPLIECAVRALIAHARAQLARRRGRRRAGQRHLAGARRSSHSATGRRERAGWRAPAHLAAADRFVRDLNLIWFVSLVRRPAEVAVILEMRIEIRMRSGRKVAPRCEQIIERHRVERSRGAELVKWQIKNHLSPSAVAPPARAAARCPRPLVSARLELVGLEPSARVGVCAPRPVAHLARSLSHAPASRLIKRVARRT